MSLRCAIKIILLKLYIKIFLTMLSMLCLNFFKHHNRNYNNIHVNLISMVLYRFHLRDHVFPRHFMLWTLRLKLCRSYSLLFLFV